MKKLFIAALLMTGMASFAQDAPRAKNNKMEQMTPEQRNQLRMKKLTLELGLNASQQKEMGNLIAEQSTKMEAAKAERKANAAANKQLTADERFARKNKMLDEQIAMNDRVKKILTPEQFEKWEKMKKHRRNEMKSHAGKRKGKQEDNRK
ncbi:MAG: hypothetical protein EOO48_04315 [Flavobacterium sp.]|nr:MAG: hypothetical protein EOO48_04315 [Flavobacterium sp.]